MSRQMTTAKGKAGHPKGKATHMHIERHDDDGFTARTHFEPPPGSANSRQSMPHHEEQQSAVFGDHNALAQHVASTFGPNDDDGDEQAA